MILKICIVDDSPEDILSIERLLASGEHRFEISKFISATAAISNPELEKADCILLDYQLPEMTGLEFIDEYNSTRQDPSPIVFMTGHGDELVAAKAIKSGASDYLVKKGLSGGLLIKTIEHSIEKKKKDVELKRTQDALKLALEEKSSLYQELQHRVKNTFNMIHSLVSMQVNETNNESTLEALKNLDRRINALSTLYGMLHLDTKKEEIRLDEYLNKIATSLFSAFSQKNEKIKLKSDLDSFTIKSREASSFGLILNELMTNAFKYAFPEGRGGSISIKLKSLSGKIIFEVSDDGVEFPPGFSLSDSRGLGLKMVNLLSIQLGGNAEFKNEGINRFVITIDGQNDKQ